MAKTVDNFLLKLKVTNDGQSRIINISFESQNPSTAAQVVNALADAYIVVAPRPEVRRRQARQLWLPTASTACVRRC